MKINYYIKTYKLTDGEAAILRQILNEDGADLDAILEQLANRWVVQLRLQHRRASACRAEVFRFITENLWTTQGPDDDRLLLTAWAHILTDRIHRRVEKLDARSRLN